VTVRAIEIGWPWYLAAAVGLALKLVGCLFRVWITVTWWRGRDPQLILAACTCIRTRSVKMTAESGCLRFVTAGWPAQVGETNRGLGSAVFKGTEGIELRESVAGVGEVLYRFFWNIMGCSE